MKLKVPKKERRKSGDSRGKHILRNVMIVLCVLALMGLAGTHLLKLITGNEMLAIPENGVAAVVTPLQSGFASVVNWISDYFYTLKLRSRLELEYIISGRRTSSSPISRCSRRKIGRASCRERV